MRKILLALITVIVAAGCTQLESRSENATAELNGEVSDSTITEDNPGELTLNAQNYGNRSNFFVEVSPVGDYKNLVIVTDRQGERTSRVNLGEAVKGATTREQFAQIRKRLNITGTARVRVNLYRKGSGTPIDTETYMFRLKEEN